VDPVDTTVATDGALEVQSVGRSVTGVFAAVNAADVNCLVPLTAIAASVG
jgi:hypothetical protein